MIWLTGWGKDDDGDGHGTCEAGDEHYHDAVIMVVVVDVVDGDGGCDDGGDDDYDMMVGLVVV